MKYRTLIAFLGKKQRDRYKSPKLSVKMMRDKIDIFDALLEAHPGKWKVLKDGILKRVDGKPISWFLLKSAKINGDLGVYLISCKPVDFLLRESNPYMYSEELEAVIFNGTYTFGEEQFAGYLPKVNEVLSSKNTDDYIKLD